MKRTKSALMKWMARSLVRLIPMGESAVDFTTDVLPTLSEEVYGWWTGNATPQERREELEAIVNADALEVQSAVEAALEDAVQEAGTPIDTVKREKVKKYLEQVPDAIRRSMKRPDDSSGRTVPPHLTPRTPKELSAILPQRPPKFNAGDKPIPGVDLELVSLLGAGGFGEVWKARKTHLGQDVALKFCLDPHAQASLSNETALLRRLMNGDATHPGIVRLQATYNDCSMLEYEYVRGGDLAGVIRDWHSAGKRPTPRQVIDAFRQIAEIVAFAHQLDPPLVHRDLKPANILVQKQNDGTLRFRLTDFGIGGIAASSAQATTQRLSTTQAASLQGSYSFLYASPQQMRAERPEPNDDVYSLGVIFWQMANGDLSDGAPGGTAWMDDLKAEGYPPTLISTLASCYDRKADRRPRTAGALVDALKIVPKPPPMPGMHGATGPTGATNTPSSNTPSSNAPTQRPQPSVPNPPTQHVTPGGVRPASGTVPVQNFVGPRSSVTPTTPTTRPTQPQRSGANWLIIGIIVAVVLVLSCIIMSIVFAAIGASTSEDYDTQSRQVSPPDPRLVGWRASMAGDSYVTQAVAPEGSVMVVQNGGNHFVLHGDGRRVPVIYDSMNNTWQIIR